MIASERFEKIVEMVDAQGIKNTKDMAALLGVTEMTIRRDCEALEQQGKLLRVRGGAKSIKKTEIISSCMSRHDENKNYMQKDAICRKAASFVKEGDCIYLDNGTSIPPILKYLKGKHLNIVTCSLLVANAFVPEKNTQLFFIGGKYIPQHDMFMDFATLDSLKRFNFDHAFISCLGMDLKQNRIYDVDMEFSALKKTAVDLSVKKYLLIDSSKFKVKGFYNSISCDEFDAVICDDALDAAPDDIPDHFILVSAGADKQSERSEQTEQK